MKCLKQYIYFPLKDKLNQEETSTWKNTQNRSAIFNKLFMFSTSNHLNDIRNAIIDKIERI